MSHTASVPVTLSQRSDMYTKSAAESGDIKCLSCVSESFGFLCVSCVRQRNMVVTVGKLNVLAYQVLGSLECRRLAPVLQPD